MKLPLPCSIATALFLGVLCAAAADPQLLFDQANKKYAQEDYAPAAQDYELLLAKNGYSVATLFNLANAYFQDGRIGPAILNYERARLLAPRNRDIQSNLSFARRQAGLTTPGRGWLAGWVDLLSLSQWAWTASVALTLLCLGTVAQKLFRHRILGLLPWLSVPVFLVATAAATFGWQEVRRAAVVTRATEGLVSPVATAKPSLPLPEGERVSLERPHNDYFLVKTPEGRRAWVEQTALTRLVPPR